MAEPMKAALLSKEIWSMSKETYSMQKEAHGTPLMPKKLQKKLRKSPNPHTSVLTSQHHPAFVI
jgi:hypothetical protein